MKPIDNIKEWAKLGDSFLNFVYSVAKTKAIGRPTGGRVPNKVLLKALRISGINEIKEFKEDIVEALLGYAWFYGFLSLEEAIEVVSNRISNMNFESKSLEMETLAKALSELLEMVKDRFEK
ncbi:MAG: hypothetical protein NZ922_00465 [Candidatus Methanomethyliaceae archaeon]|nr:hypothetical protein [Candidatus Methanomethyliaceae archaeon]MDW7970453.1 ribonuclease III family protein [Nitrososphaerota archaeon]